MLVKPKYKQTMHFPVDVRVPLEIAIQFIDGRYLHIADAEQPIPQPLYEWLATNHACTGWFDGDGEIIDPSVQQPAPDLDLGDGGSDDEEEDAETEEKQEVSNGQVADQVEFVAPKRGRKSKA